MGAGETSPPFFMSQMFLDDGPKATGQKVMLATPVYEKPAACYVFSIAKSREALHGAGIQTAYLLLSGNCHVDDARNSIVQEFLLSDCTDLVFLDADVSWEPEQLIQLCRYASDVVAGVYPFRRDDEKSKKNMPIVMFPEETPDADGLLEVAGLPTGFMRIRRHVLETLAKDANQFWSKADRRAKVPIIFERTFFDDVRLGGDLSFCKKWILKGGKVHAALNLTLGHQAQSLVYDSLGAFLRRRSNQTLPYLVSRIRESGEWVDPQVFSEARRALGNAFGALEDVLALCAVMGRKAEGPILEAGSGLSSIVLAAASNQPVYCLEHSDVWSAEIERMAQEAGLSNIHIVRCGIADHWYDVPKGLPSEFALALNDGPPRTVGNRMGFFDRFGSVPNIIVDDADDKDYGDQLLSWAASHSRRIDFLERAAVIRLKEAA